MIRIKKNEIFLEKQFTKVDSKILSVCWESDKVFFTGHSNGTICKWDYSIGSILLTFNISSNKLLKKQLENVMVWVVSSFSEKMLISGDSLGKLSIWDSNFGILVKDFKEHEADILTICKNPTLDSFYFSGSDSLVCSIQYINSEFLLTSKFRGQSHDINSLVLLNETCLLSGGLTTDICLYKLENGRFIEKYDKKVSSSKIIISTTNYRRKKTYICI
jgi:U3 small nucleolar RNA-associated protein 4